MPDLYTERDPQVERAECRSLLAKFREALRCNAGFVRTMQAFGMTSDDIKALERHTALAQRPAVAAAKPRVKVSMRNVTSEEMNGPGVLVLGDWVCPYTVALDHVRIAGGSVDLRNLKAIHGKLFVGSGCRVNAAALETCDEVVLSAGSSIEMPWGLVENKG